MRDGAEALELEVAFLDSCQLSRRTAQEGTHGPVSEL